MAIYLPETTRTSTESLTPRQIVAELDKYVVGQPAAKRAVAIALRNRMRRQKLTPEMAEEVAPKNILKVGANRRRETEIAPGSRASRPVALREGRGQQVHQVGYVGAMSVDGSRPVSSRSTWSGRSGSRKSGRRPCRTPRIAAGSVAADASAPGNVPGTPPRREQQTRTRERFREQLGSGQLDARIVELDVREKSFPSMEIIAGSSVEEVDVNIKDMLPGLFQGRTKKRKVKVPEALEYLTQEEEQKLIDMDSVSRTAVERVQQAGIIFIDEIDKIAGREGAQGPDVSREGVQRDILPIVEGTTVNTKYGMVRTDHILFIAAGAFHVSKPSDLIPELQGRFPIRVELHPLGKDEFVRILTEPRSALIKQYTALMETEGIDLTFTDGAIQRVAELATIVNDRTENIGARRLHTVMEKLLDEISFEGPDLANKRVTIDEAYVTKMLAEIVKNEDLSRYIL